MSAPLIHEQARSHLESLAVLAALEPERYKERYEAARLIPLPEPEPVPDPVQINKDLLEALQDIMAGYAKGGPGVWHRLYGPSITTLEKARKAIAGATL